MQEQKRKKQITWTQEQSQIINSRKKHLLISASAGSGKTTVMIERIISLLKEGYGIEDFFVSTFTKAAAADMKHKLTLRLRESGEEHLTQQIKKLQDADVTNIDSFCKKLVTRYFYKAGVDPDFQILSEAEANALLNSSLDDVFDRYENSGDQIFLQLKEYMASGGVDNLRLAVKSLYLHCSLYPSPDLFLSRLEKKDYYEETKKLLAKKTKRVLEKLKDFAKKCKKAGNVRNEKGTRKIIECILEGNPEFPKLSGSVGDFGEQNEEYKSLKKEASELFLQKEDETPAIINAKKIIEITKQVKRRYDEKKKQNSKLDFSDVEQCAYNILKDVEISKSISQKYKFVFVDEYQDINPLQEKIISQINAQKFMVGDLKQSIYAFRGCQPQIFERKIKNGKKEEKGLQLISLNANYRCGEKIVDFVNAIFDEIMTDDSVGVNYKKDARLIAKSGIEGFSPRIIEYEPQKEEATEFFNVEVGTVDSVEAEDVACRIAELVSGIEENGKRRAFGFGEIAVLVRAVDGSVLALIDKLRKRGIPFYFSRKTKFFTIKEVRMILSCLKLIDNNKDEIALAGTMLSYVGGFSPAELLKLKQKDKSFFKSVFGENGERLKKDWTGFLAKNGLEENSELYLHSDQLSEFDGKQNGIDELNSKLEKFIQKIKRYNELSLKTAVDELTGIIIEENDFFLHAFAKGSDAEGLDEFLQYVCESSTKESLHEFLKNIENSPPEYQAKGGSDAVQIMTIHGSKGLEFPAVILMSAGKGFNFSDSSLPLVIDEENIAIKGYDKIGAREYKTELYTLLLDEKERKERAEEYRLLYVALTRAKEFLEIYGSGERGYMSLLKGVRNTYGSYPQKKVQKRAEERILVYPKNDALTKKIVERIEFSLPKNTAPQKTYVTKLTEDKNTVLVRGDLPSFEATQRGNAYHFIMERVDFNDFENTFDALPQNLKEQVNKEKIKSASIQIANLTKNMKTYKEQPFIFPVASADFGYEGEDILVQGVVDFMALKEDECIIVDYKTGREEYAFSQKNVAQIKLYKKAVQETLGLNVRAYIFSFDTCVLREFCIED